MHLLCLTFYNNKKENNLVRYFFLFHNRLSDPDIENPVDNEALLCIHGKFNPDKTGKAKCISSEAAGMIYAKFGGGPRLCG